MSKVITIGREFGSGGREVGVKLAGKLGVPFYDKEIVAKAAERLDLTEEFLSRSDEAAPGGFGTLMYPSTAFTVYQQPMSDRLFLEQSGIIKKLAAKGPCVIVGRCADYVLRGTGAVNVFIHAELRDRIARKLAMDIGVAPEDMEKHVLGIDKKRKKYYEFYTDQRWGDLKHFDLTVNTSRTGTDGAVETILAFIASCRG